MQIETIVKNELEQGYVHCHISVFPEFYTDKIKEYFKSKGFYIDERCFNKFQASPLITGCVKKENIKEMEELGCVDYITKVRNLQSAGNWMLPSYCDYL